MESTFIITFIGDDRPGLVEELSSTIARFGGNWQESRLSQLAGKFAGLVQVTLASEQCEALRLALKTMDQQGFSVRVTPAGSTGASVESQQLLRLSILGPDRPGIVREVSAALAAQSINVIDMHSHVSSAPMSAELLFNANVEAEVPEDTDLEELADRLEQVSDEMDVDIHLNPG